MDYNALLDLALNLGYELAMSGAETFRVEESINRVLAAYHISSDVFAIPNYLIVSIHTPDGQSLTRMRRIGHHGNDPGTAQHTDGGRLVIIAGPDSKISRAEVSGLLYLAEISAGFLDADDIVLFRQLGHDVHGEADARPTRNVVDNSF